MFKIATQKKNSSFYAFFICCLASLFYVYDYFIQVAPSVMTQQLMRSFSIGAGELGILSSCFYYSYTLMQIPAGLLLDRLGARVLITLAVLCSAVGITLFGVTYNFMTAGFARFIVGLGSSFSFISALFLISRWFPHRHFALAAGLVQLAGCVGSLFGLAPFAMLVNSMGWRHSLILAGLITFSFAFLFWIFIRDGKRDQLKQVTLRSGNEWERLKLVLRQTQIWWIAGAGFMSWVPVTIIGALWGVPYFMKAYGLTNTEAGKLCSLFWVGLGIGSPLIGWISNQLKNRCIPLAICFVLGLIGSVLILNALSVPISLMGVALILLGMSSSAQSLSFGFIKDIVPPSLFGTASGINNMAAILGGAIAQPLVGYLLNAGWSGLKIQGVPIYSFKDYQVALLFLPLSALCGLAIALLKTKETHCEMQYSAQPKIEPTADHF